MKRIVSLVSAVALLVCCAAFTSCDPSKKADNEVAIRSIKLTAELNPGISKDITGTISTADKTMSFAIPVSLANRNLIPTFTVSDNDYITQDGNKIVSGESTILVEEGKSLTVSDDVSGLSVTYTIKVIDNDEKAVLNSVLFAAADNELLEADVVPEQISENMLVRVPGNAFLQTLVISVSCGEGDVVKVNGSEPVDGKLTVDTAFPIDITVTDEVAGATSKYVLKVGKILGYVVSKLGEYSKPDAKMNDYHALAINPVDKLPYILFTATDNHTTKARFNVVKWDGSAFSLVGEPSFSDTTATASTPSICFDNNGTPFVMYKGGEVSSFYSVRKLEGGKWNRVGESTSTVKVTSQMIDPELCIDAKGNPYHYFSGNTKNTPSYRNTTLTYFDSNSWNESVVSTLPTYGSGSTSSSGTYYGTRFAKCGSDTYGLFHYNQFGFYIMKINDDRSLSPVVENYIPEGESYALPGNADICADDEGQLYVLEGSHQAGKMQIYKIDPEKSSVAAYGSPIPVTVGSSGSISEDLVFAINGSDKTIVLVKGAEEGDLDVLSIAIGDENAQFAEFRRLGESSYKRVPHLEYASDNTFYASYVAYNATDKIYWIELYKIALEEDIIPGE